MKNWISLLSLSAICAFAFAGCYNDKYDQLYPAPKNVTCDTSSITFTKDILPIFNANCNMAGCHGSSGNTSGTDLTSYTGATKTNVKRNMLSDVNQTSNPMPKGGSKLAQCDINKLTKWVNSGYPQ